MASAEYWFLRRVVKSLENRIVRQWNIARFPQLAIPWRSLRSFASLRERYSSLADRAHSSPNNDRRLA
jgi:hypothetical protein